MLLTNCLDMHIFFELRQRGVYVNPNHTFETLVEEYFDTEMGIPWSRTVWVRSNYELESHITKVVSRALQNYDNKH